MARVFVADVDILGFSLLNARLHPVSANPSGLGAGNSGRVWYNTTTNRFMVWNGTAAIDILDRVNQSGTQVAATISDLATAVQAYPLSAFGIPTAALNAGGFRITNTADGIANSDVATFGQLLQFLNNKSFKDPCRLGTLVNDTLSGLGARDGVTPVAGDRVLVMFQTAGSANGIYLAAAGAWARSTDFDTSAEAVPGTVVAVQEGTTNADKLFLLATNGPITLGTTALTFSPYGTSTGEIGIAGAGLLKTGTTYDVGAGLGVSVLADSIQIDTARVPRKWAGVVPTASGTVDTLPITVSGGSVTFNHATGNVNPRVNIRYGSAGTSPGQLLGVDDTTNGDANNVIVTFPATPLANQYTFLVQA